MKLIASLLHIVGICAASIYGKGCTARTILLPAWQNKGDRQLDTCLSFQALPLEFDISVPVGNIKQPYESNKTAAILPETAKRPYFCHAVDQLKKRVSSRLAFPGFC